VYRELALVLVGVVGVETGGHDVLQHGVAQELEALAGAQLERVAVVGQRRVREGLDPTRQQINRRNKYK
jgi:hypothetical protein